MAVAAGLADFAGAVRVMRMIVVGMSVMRMAVVVVAVRVALGVIMAVMCMSFGVRMHMAM